MKKIILIALSLVITSGGLFAADLYNIETLSGQSKAYADSQFEGFASLMAQALNGGMGDMMNIGTIKAGVQLSLIPFDDSGILKNSSVSMLPMPFAYGGISLMGVTAFARAMYLPVRSKNNYPLVYGLGLAYEFDPLPLFTLAPAVTYHGTHNFNLLSIDSYGFQLQGRINLMLITPYANVGLAYTNFQGDFTLDSGKKYEYSNTLISAAAGIKIVMFFAEISFLPEVSYTAGASIGF